MDIIQKTLLAEIADLHEVPEGAYNIRKNGELDSRNTTANINIVTKEDKPGIDIIIAPGTKKESIHIPVIISETGLKDLVYNDFYVGEDADALTAQLYPNIVASTPFLVDMLDTRVKTANGKMDTTLQAYIISQFTFFQKVKSLPYVVKRKITDLFKDPIVLGEAGETSYLTEEKNGLVSILRESFEVAVDKKTSVSTIMVTFNDQMVTAMVADTLIVKLQEKITEYRLAKAVDDCKYWEEIYKESKEDYFAKQNEYARYVDTNKNLVKQSVIAEQERLENETLLAYQIYSNVATQLQMARAKVQEAKPAFVVVQPSVFPYEASGTSKTTTVLVLTFLGVAIVIAWYLFGKEYWLVVKNKYKEFRNNTKESNITNS